MPPRQGSKFFLLASTAALLWLGAGTLAAQDVRYNYMPGTDFSKYHTYKWVSVDPCGHSGSRYV
jgi:hypothetical protein